MIMSFEQKKTTTDIALEPQGLTMETCSVVSENKYVFFLLGKNKGYEAGD